jgi:hypothetical protein
MTYTWDNARIVGSGDADDKLAMDVAGGVRHPNPGGDFKQYQAVGSRPGSGAKSIMRCKAEGLKAQKDVIKVSKGQQKSSWETQP